MSARDAILARVRANRPPAIELPELPGVARSGDKLPDVARSGAETSEAAQSGAETSDAARFGKGMSEPSRSGEELPGAFATALERMGGRCLPVERPTDAAATVDELFPYAHVVCSAVDELPGTRRVAEACDPHDLADVDVGVVRARLGVAETGAVWVTERELVVTAVAILSQHLVVLLDRRAIVADTLDAYRAIDVADSPYGLFMAGPSATADIGSVLIHGAQGARSLTVLLVAENA